MQDVYIADDHDANSITLRLNVVKKNQIAEIEVDGNTKISELYQVIAELIESEEKNLRLMARGERMNNKETKTVREYFNSQPGVIEEVTVFFETLGASL